MTHGQWVLFGARLSTVVAIVLAVLAVMLHTGVVHKILSAPAVEPHLFPLIASRCGYDERKDVLCTDSQCFVRPHIVSLGPPIPTLIGTKLPAWLGLSHQIGVKGWRTHTINITDIAVIRCVSNKLPTASKYIDGIYAHA